MNPTTRRTPLQDKEFPKDSIASLALAVALLGTLAGCGKSAAPTAPVPDSGNVSGPSAQTEARQVAQQSATMAVAYLARAKSLLTLVRVPGARPAAERPFKDLATASDSISFTYSFQGYDIKGNPIDWARQGNLLASLAMDFRWYLESNSDSLTFQYDVRSHGRVDGLEAAATQFVANGTDTLFATSNACFSGYHVVSDCVATSQVTNLTWEKSGAPAYAVAGAFAEHWQGAYEYWYGAQHGTGIIDFAVTITFNGTRYASMQVGAYTFTLDLETGAVS